MREAPERFSWGGIF
ncbi:hypothetical protein ACLMNJ_38045, partial [Streptomyces seoulensis]